MFGCVSPQRTAWFSVVSFPSTLHDRSGHFVLIAKKILPQNVHPNRTRMIFAYVSLVALAGAVAYSVVLTRRIYRLTRK